ncbi:thioredoxin fold domain-containing protein [Candidatus Bathyarchaeota archaeon]|nr:thioredoxin fold domain-containing protein [Candidatus Bathyarchaeota archaeon]
MTHVYIVNSNNWENEVIKADGLVIVDFWHKQCPWCLRLSPIYEEVAEEYHDKAKFTALNVFETHENQHIALHLGVMSTPTLMFFCQGKPIAMVVGFQTKDGLKQLVENILANYKECVRKRTEIKIT